METPSIDTITQRAIRKLDNYTLNEVLTYIDSKLPLPSCAIKRSQVEWLRNKVKENVQAYYRQIKVTGPTMTK